MAFTATRAVPRHLVHAPAGWTCSTVARGTTTVVTGQPVVGWAYREVAGRSSDYPSACVADDLGAVRFADEYDGGVLILGPNQTATAAQTSALVARAGS